MPPARGNKQCTPVISSLRLPMVSNPAMRRYAAKRSTEHYPAGDRELPLEEISSRGHVNRAASRLVDGIEGTLEWAVASVTASATAPNVLTLNEQGTASLSCWAPSATLGVPNNVIAPVATPRESRSRREEVSLS